MCEYLTRKLPKVVLYMLIAHEASKLQDIKVECPTKFTIQSMLTEQRVGFMKEEGPGLDVVMNLKL